MTGIPSAYTEPSAKTQGCTMKLRNPFSAVRQITMMSE
jgi:hypothetical protein